MILFSRLYFKVAHPKAEYNPAFFYFYTLSMILFSRLDFKVAHSKVQYNLEILLVASVYIRIIVL